MDEKEIVRDYKEIRQDYEWDPSIFSEEPERIARVKYIIQHRLPEVDRIIILLYIDCQSYRKLGKRLGISHTTAAQEVRRIRERILLEYQKIKDNANF